MNASTKISGLLRLFRVELPFAAGICVLLGELLALGALPTPGQAALGFGSVFLISAAALIFNDYFDIEIDRINAPQRSIPSGAVTPREALLLGVAVSVTGLVLAALLGMRVFWVALLVWAVGFLYNWRFKRAGLVGNLMVSFSVGMTFLFGGLAVDLPFAPAVWFFAVLAALIDLGEEISADALDVEGDRAGGSRSLAVVLGQRTALRIGAGIFAFVVILSAVPFVLGWFSLPYLVPIAFMDAVIVYAVVRLLDPGAGEQRRSYVRWIYLGATAAMVVFLGIQMVGLG
jgi:geranylgeranylglycerol-phosphate geranylgeranyltransferase